MGKRIEKILRITALLLCAVTVLCSAVACSRKGETVMSLGKHTVTANMYSYWLASYKSYLLYLYNQSEDSADFWKEDVGGMTAEEYGNEFAMSNVKNVLVGLKLFDEYGLSLPQETISAVDSQIADYIEYYGSEAAFNSILAEVNINVDILKDIYIAEEKLSVVYDHLFGEGRGITVHDVEEYFSEHYSRIKVVIVYTQQILTDGNGEYLYGEDGYLATQELSEEEIASKREKASEVFELAKGGADFDSLVSEYSEFDMSTYPNGLYISENELSYYGYYLVYGAMSMEVGDIEMVEDEGAVYIISKQELPTYSSLSASEAAQLEDIATYASNEKYTELLQSEAEAIVINQNLISEYSIATSASNIIF